MDQHLLLTLFDDMKTEMQKQTNLIMQKMEEKLNPIVKEIIDLKSENKNLREKIDNLERENRRNNIVAFGVKEEEISKQNLIEIVTKKIQSKINIDISHNDINNIYRLGKKGAESEKPRPVLISLSHAWKKEQIMRNKKKLPEIYLTEDYPKNVLIKRKELQQQLIEERQKGKYAVLKYDKLIVRDNIETKEKRKRERSVSNSPQKYAQKSNLQSTKTTKTGRSNAFDMMRGRSNSLTALPPITKQA